MVLELASLHLGDHSESVGDERLSHIEQLHLHLLYES
jgi:hypothetical protein